MRPVDLKCFVPICFSLTITALCLFLSAGHMDWPKAWVLLGVSLVTGIAFTAIPISAIWLVLGVWLGRRQAKLASGETKQGAALSQLVPTPQT